MEIISSSRESLASQVQRAVVDAIAVGELAPGSLHSVAKLADRLQVSRSPVREALITLSEQGVVAFERNRGVRILQSTARDLEEVFSLRILLEVPATFRAAQLVRAEDVDRLRTALGTVEEFEAAPSVQAQQEMERRFHGAILDAAGNERLSATVDGLWSLQRVRGITTAGRSRGLRSIYAEHHAVYERLAARDARGAAAAMRRHLENAGRLMLAQETGVPAEDPPQLPWAAVYDGLDGPGEGTE